MDAATKITKRSFFILAHVAFYKVKYYVERVLESFFDLKLITRSSISISIECEVKIPFLKNSQTELFSDETSLVGSHRTQSSCMWAFDSLLDPRVFRLLRWFSPLGIRRSRRPQVCQPVR